MINKELEDNISALHTDARRRGLGQITVEHLTLVLLKENTAVREMLVDCSADINGLKGKLKQFISTYVPAAKNYGEEPQLTSSFNRVLQRAEQRAVSRSRQKASGLHVLAEIFSEPESYAAYHMQKYGIERLMLLNRVESYTERGGINKKSGKNDANLVAQAAAGKIEKPSGRLAEVGMLSKILLCKYKNNALLVGDPGVGKTAIVHALAYHIAEEKTPPALADTQIIPINVADLVAGTKYRGDFEQRIQQLVEKSRAHGNTIIFIDEIHTLIGAGAVSGGMLDGANILKPMLEEKDVRYIGATTQTDYRRLFEKDHALNRRFNKIIVREPDEETLKRIMQKSITQLSAHHGVIYAADAAAAAIETSRRYLPMRCLPDKAITLLDEAGAYHQLTSQSQPIDKPDIELLARQAAGLSSIADQQQKGELAHLQQKLSEAVLEQNEAAQRLARAVLCSQLNYQERDSVVGAFLFYGPTGVGKTEMARQLARQLAVPLLRYDMSEYMERHAVSRLIGAPPGYIGFEQSGKLIEDVAQHPLSVVLFDEVEKSHPDVLNILLQILDYGTLTDNSGRSADFRNTLIIMTSNLGSYELERAAAGFERSLEDGRGDEAVRNFFTPEMRNRIDALIRFRPLSTKTVARIVDMRLAAALAHIKQKKNIHVDITAAYRRRLYKDSYSPTMGARPLQQLIKENVLEPLALAEANGIVTNGGRYRLSDRGITLLQKKKSRQRCKTAVTV